ncbi:hypothetical protein IT575_05385 [bacterium]|nr:hypothetical protein [bacterium]
MPTLCVALLTLLVVCGCKHEARVADDLMLPGLSLPPGSTERSRMDTPSLDSAQAADYDIVDGRTEEAVMVIGFDCDSDWAAVKAHFDAILLPQGYGDAKFPRIVEIVRQTSPKLSAEETEARARKVMQQADATAGESAEYGAADKLYNVVLRDESKNKEILGSAGDALGDYSLMVIRLSD